MTLVVGWIRNIKQPEELVFATDSTLTGGEQWDHGVKLFELPRKDCLICFAGSTRRAYPLVLNLISSMRFDPKLQNQHTDIGEVAHYLADLFTDLIRKVKSEIQGENIHQLRKDAYEEGVPGIRFMFGGWSWKEGRFRIWKLSYSEDIEGFIAKEETGNARKAKHCYFLGDPADRIERIANERYRKELEDNDAFDDNLDMEPLKALISISRDGAIREVNGAIQIGKVYRSGTTEFFGIMWPSTNGTPHFLGREFTEHNKPKMRYFDPDTLEIIEKHLPKRLDEQMSLEEHPDYRFITECYPEGQLKSDLGEFEKEKLIKIFREYSYDYFLNHAENGIIQIV